MERSFAAEPATPPILPVTVPTTGRLSTLPTTGAPSGTVDTLDMGDVGAARTLEPRVRAAMEMVVNFILTFEKVKMESLKGLEKDKDSTGMNERLSESTKRLGRK